MGDNIYLGDRNGVRTPMQWTGDRNAGFSRADPARLYAPLIMDPVYGYQAINVEAQERAPFSLLNWMKRMIALRKQFKVFGRGTLEFLPARRTARSSPTCAATRARSILCVANLSRTVQPVELDLVAVRGHDAGRDAGPRPSSRASASCPYFLTLPGYCFYWFRLQQAPVADHGAARARNRRAGRTALPAFFMGVAWDTLLDGNVRTLIERESLVPFLQRQRWFGGKARRVRAARFLDWGLLRRGPHPLFLTIVEVDYEDGGRRAVFPAAGDLSRAADDAVLERDAAARCWRASPARARASSSTRRPTTLPARALLEALRQEQDGARPSAARLARRRTAPSPRCAAARPRSPSRRLPREQSNTSLALRRSADPQAVPPAVEPARIPTSRSAST